jgi:AcrR family transcriptional regulator
MAAGHPQKKRVRKTKEVRRREIAEAALDLVAKHGLDGATVSRIAQAVHLTRGALYRHFPSREAVLLAAMDLLGERASTWVAPTTESNVYEQFRAMGRSHAAWAESQLETFVRPSFEFIAGGEQRDLSGPNSERQMAVFRRLVERVDEGKRQGTIRPDVQSEDVAWSILMFAWAEDVARLMGVRDCITSGASVRTFERLLDCYKSDPAT